MNIATIKKLNKINQDFYKTTATDFDDSRQYFWEGWEQLKKYLGDFDKLKLLDLGCGNARFYQFLEQNFADTKIYYLGVDNSQKLLDFAQKKFGGETSDEQRTSNNKKSNSITSNFNLQESDLIESLLEKNDFIKSDNFDAIVSFGVFHHIPSFELKLELLNYLTSKLTSGGIIIISLWQFMDYERFRKKVVSEAKLKNMEIFKNLELEKNDFILDWKRGEKAYRYCHFIDDNEQKELIKESGLQLIYSFRADGKEKDVNKYLILKRV